jgi:hypothetical protein
MGGPAFASLCTVDDVPAATLLLPYFEVDLNSPSGITTLFSVNNASAAPVLAHVTLWTDWSIPTIDFDLFLTGYDVQSFNVRDIFNGIVPQTGPDEFPAGAFSLANAVPANCTADDLPVGDLPGALITLIRQAHTGVAVNFPGFDGDCAGDPYGDNIARGYITVDVVQQCSTEFPNTQGYHDQIIGFDNVLWGDYFYVDPTNNFAQGETLVHVEADPAQQAFAPGDYTFYGRYVGFQATDQREPLASIFATRYINGGVFTGGTNLVCWRDSKADPAPQVCGSGRPAPMSLSQNQVVIFDEDENPELVEETNFSPALQDDAVLVCPIESQRTIVGGVDFPVNPNFGWLYLNLNTTVTGAGINPYAQAWVTTVMDASGLFSVGFDAIQLNNLCVPTDVILPVI